MEVELNSFLAKHRVVTIERRFVDCGTDSFWALCVDFLHGEPKLTAWHILSVFEKHKSFIYMGSIDNFIQNLPRSGLYF